MSKIYYVRHQAGGLLWEFPFAQPPTDSQKAALEALCRNLHGSVHPKTEKPYWLTVAEVDLLDSAALPDVGGAGPSESSASAPQFSAQGVGYVTKENS